MLDHPQLIVDFYYLRLLEELLERLAEERVQVREYAADYLFLRVLNRVRQYSEDEVLKHIHQQSTSLCRD